MKIDNPFVKPDVAPCPTENQFWEKFRAIPFGSDKTNYGDLARAYEILEAEVQQIATKANFDLLAMKRTIAQRLMVAAYDHEEPFDVCRSNWEALVSLGFSSIEVFCSMAGIYIECCLLHTQYDIGLEVTDMVNVELQRRFDVAELTSNTENYYKHELSMFARRRDELLALRVCEVEGDAYNKCQEVPAESERDKESTP